MQVIFVNYSFFLLYPPSFLLIFKPNPKITLKNKEIRFRVVSLYPSFLQPLQFQKINDSEIVFRYGKTPASGWVFAGATHRTYTKDPSADGIHPANSSANQANLLPRRRHAGITPFWQGNPPSADRRHGLMKHRPASLAKAGPLPDSDGKSVLPRQVRFTSITVSQTANHSRPPRRKKRESFPIPS